MNPSIRRIPLVVMVLVLGSGIAAVNYGDRDAPSETSGDPQTEQEEIPNFPFGPVTLDDTAVLLGITNHASHEQYVTVTLEMEGPIRTAGGVNAALYRGERGNGSATPVFLGSVWGQDNPVLRIQQGGEGIHAPVTEEDVYEATDLFGEGVNASYDVSLPPGSHILFMGLSHYKGDWGVHASAGNDDVFSWEILKEDPEMYKVGFTNAEGHWDHVETEVWSPRAGFVRASTSLVSRHSFSSVFVAPSGTYNDVNTQDSEGNRCEASGNWLLDPNASSLWAWLPPGEVKIEGWTINRYPPFIFYSFFDLPIDREVDPHCFEAWNEEEKATIEPHLH